MVTVMWGRFSNSLQVSGCPSGHPPGYQGQCDGNNGLLIQDSLWFQGPEHKIPPYVGPTVTDVAADPEQDEGLLVYPNPFENVLNIEGEIFQSGQSYTVNVIDHTGRLILQMEQESSELYLGNLPSGLYFIQILTTGNQYTSKIVKR